MIDYAKLAGSVVCAALYGTFVYVSLRIGFLVIDALEKYLGVS